jgi:hypothetical protein
MPSTHDWIAAAEARLAVLPEEAAARRAAREPKPRQPREPKPRQPREPRTMATRPFMGIDGEGCGQDRHGRQHYKLLCAGNSQTSYECFKNGKPLTTHDCLSFICSLPREPILVGFSFGYDVTQILRDIPGDKRCACPHWPIHERTCNINSRSRRERILAEKPFGQGGRYTYWGDFAIEYLPKNYLRVARMEKVTVADPHSNVTRIIERPVKHSARTIYETFRFFQKRFARALTDFDIGTSKERAMITRNKAERAAFKSVTREVRAYCKLECDLLSRMMEKLRGACHDAGLRPKWWTGAGQLASALHEREGTVLREQLAKLRNIPKGAHQFAQWAYYGGRFEITRIGAVDGPIYEYDINSAYPAAMRDLPCLVHGKWTVATRSELERLSPDALFVAHATFNYRRNLAEPRPMMCGLPLRQKDGRICWPERGHGVYWSFEIRSAQRLGAHITYGERENLRAGYVYSKRCDCKPFGFVDDLYRTRKALGKATAGTVIKLALNALYGKLAQRIGNPKFGNFLYAGMITALVRAKLNEAIAEAPGEIVMVATDGIYSKRRLSLPVGSDLGAWEAKEHAGLFLVQPGVYWDGKRANDPKRAFHSRGVSAGFVRQRRRTQIFERAWQRFHADFDKPGFKIPTVALPVRLFVGIKLAQSRGAPGTAGKWTEDIRRFSFDWSGKRNAMLPHRWEAGPCLVTVPKPGALDWVSLTHLADESLIERLDFEQAELDDQPDLFVFTHD